MNIDWNQFAVVAFIDSNVALECLALEQLPWRELHNAGPILVLVTPTVLQEVDSKKNHARLGDHARRFNRALRPLLGAAQTIVIREAPAPKVEIAFADCDRIDWGQYPDLDPDEPDSRVVAQALTARGPSQPSRVVVSQDIRPLHLARRSGLDTHHIGENWLRPKEISEHEKKAAALKREIDDIRRRQPALKMSVKASKNNVAVHNVRDLSVQERKKIEGTIVNLYPMPTQSENPLHPYTSLGAYDHSLSERYKRWEEKILPKFMRQYERKLELNFGQIEIFFRIESVGQVPAESLLIRLSVEGGWLNEHYVLASPTGPSAPRVRQNEFLMRPAIHNQMFQPVVLPGQHEFVFQEKPARSSMVQITCADFRHGCDYEYRMIGWVDPRAEEFRVEAVVTAANLYGERKESMTVVKTVTESSVYDLVDPETLKFRLPNEYVELLDAARSKRDFSDFEFDGANWDK